MRARWAGPILLSLLCYAIIRTTIGALVFFMINEAADLHSLLLNLCYSFICFCQAGTPPTLSVVFMIHSCKFLPPTLLQPLHKIVLGENLLFYTILLVN
jgi:hypothetical protein